LAIYVVIFYLEEAKYNTVNFIFTTNNHFKTYF